MPRWFPDTGAAASPFVVAIQNASIPGLSHLSRGLIFLVLPGFLNACILLFVISAANSDLYICSRTLYALALGGSAPAILAKTDKRGVPIVSLGVCASFCCLAYLNVVEASAVVFKYLYSIAPTLFIDGKCEPCYDFRTVDLDLNIGRTYWLFKGGIFFRVCSRAVYQSARDRPEERSSLSLSSWSAWNMVCLNILHPCYDF